MKQEKFIEIKNGEIVIEVDTDLKTVKVQVPTSDVDDEIMKGVIYIATYKTDEEKDTYVNSLLMCLDDGDRDESIKLNGKNVLKFIDSIMKPCEVIEDVTL